MAKEVKKEEGEKIVWYKKWWGVLIVIFLILPYFLIWQIWAKTKWSMLAKILLTAGIVGFYILIFSGAGGSSTPSKTADSKTVTATATAKVLSPEEQKKLDEENAKKEAEAKAQAEAKAESEKELDAEVRFSDVAFMIKNKEDKDWANCKFVLNGKVFGSDYTYKTTEGINANDSVIVAMREFTKGDGTRFNPDATKAKNLFLSCDVGTNHRTGYYAISE